ncbi:MAG TPA: YkgJ family cysteine cluster protein [Candidatus Binatia bacterium]|nr:YkgJ family cysteine cluster protein [Candidatus Binatia bacterium]
MKNCGWRKKTQIVVCNIHHSMRCSNCGVCCTETEMLLSKKDIKRLEEKGFSENQFVDFDSQGYAQLKNRDSYCVFYDLENRQCSVYEDRPTGCRVYPVIFHEGKGIILDDICESRKSITRSEKNLKGKRVIKLLETIDSEASKRSARKNL